MSKPPDRGSFPLDHFHECDQQAKTYSNCIIKHQLMPKRCRDWQVKYLQCRMKSGLMESQEMKKLGFLQENSWSTQEAQRRVLYQEIQKSKEKAWRIALEREKQKVSQQQQKVQPKVKLPQ